MSAKGDPTSREPDDLGMVEIAYEVALRFSSDGIQEYARLQCDRDVKTHHFTRSSHDRLGRESILRRASLDNVHDVEIVTRAVVELKKKVEIGFTDSTKIKRLPSSALASRQVFVGEASRV